MGSYSECYRRGVPVVGWVLVGDDREVAVSDMMYTSRYLSANDSGCAACIRNAIGLVSQCGDHPEHVETNHRDGIHRVLTPEKGQEALTLFMDGNSVQHVVFRMNHHYRGDEIQQVLRDAIKTLAVDSARRMVGLSTIPEDRQLPRYAEPPETYEEKVGDFTLYFSETAGDECMTGAWLILKGTKVLACVDQLAYGQWRCAYAFRSWPAERAARICFKAMVQEY